MGAFCSFNPRSRSRLLSNRSWSIFRPASGKRFQAMLARVRTATVACWPTTALPFSTHAASFGEANRFNCSRSVSEPVIDAAAQTVIYTSTTAGASIPRYLRVYNIATKQDSVFVQPNGEPTRPPLVPMASA